MPRHELVRWGIHQGMLGLPQIRLRGSSFSPALLVPLLQRPRRLLLHDVDLLRQHPGAIERGHEDLKELWRLVRDELRRVKHRIQLGIGASGVRPRLVGREERQHGLVVPRGDVVVGLCWAVDYPLDRVPAVVDEDDGGGEAVAEDCADFLDGQLQAAVADEEP
jgi:hypothetical protein